MYNWLFVFGMSEVLLITITQINPTASFAIQSVAIFFAGASPVLSLSSFLTPLSRIIASSCIGFHSHFSISDRT